MAIRIMLLVLSVATMPVAGCARYESAAPPVSTAGAGGSAQQPEPPNSLPRGSAVNAPLEPAAGVRTTTAF